MADCKMRVGVAIAFALVLLAAAPPALASEPLYATYLGGSAFEDIGFVERGPDEGTIIVGSTQSADFPGTRPVPGRGGGTDVFVTSYDRQGRLVFSVVMGGERADHPTVCRVGRDGSVTVLGITYSRDFPTRNPHQKKHRGQDEGFVFRLDARGELVYSTFLGTKGLDEIRLLEVDDDGYAYIAGSTDSNGKGYRTTRGALSRHFNTRLPSDYPGPDGVFTKLDPTGKAVTSTYISGRHQDYVSSLHVLSDGGVILIGRTSSDNFVTINPQQPEDEHPYDTFIVRLDGSGQLVYSRLFGGSKTDEPGWSAVGDDGSAVILGFTRSLDLPVVNAFQASIDYPWSYVAKYDGAGTLVYATYLGGISPQSGDDAFHVDAAGNTYIKGLVGSGAWASFPLVAAFDATPAGYSEASLTKIAPNGACVFSTWIGGSDADGIAEMHVGDDGIVTLVGVTHSPDFPTAGEENRSFGGGRDVFVMRVDQVGDLLFSTLLGGEGGDELVDATVSASGEVFVLGSTEADDFPVTSNSFPRGRNREGFVAKIDGRGRLAFSVLLGANVTNGESTARVLARADGGALVASTIDIFGASELHQVDPLASGDNGQDDSMAIVLGPEGRMLLSTYLGGSSSDRLRSVRVSESGAAVVVLHTTSPNMLVREAPQAAFGGLADQYLISFGP